MKSKIKVFWINFRLKYLNFPIIDKNGYYKKYRFQEEEGNFIIDWKKQITHCSTANYRFYNIYKWGSSPSRV